MAGRAGIMDLVVSRIDRNAGRCTGYAGRQMAGIAVPRISNPGQMAGVAVEWEVDTMAGFTGPASGRHG